MFSLPIDDRIDLHTIRERIVPEAEFEIVAADVNGSMVDLSTVLEPSPEPYKIRFIRRDTDEGALIIRHSTAHLLARAVQELWGQNSERGRRIPQGTGPASAEGFFQDFEFNNGVGAVDSAALERISERMRAIAGRGNRYRRLEISKEEARRVFSDDPYKLDLLDRFGDETVSIYDHGDGYIDLCRGPHVPGDRWLGSFRLLDVSAAHWLSNTGDQALTRIRGLAEPDEERLRVRVVQREEAERRDHRRIGADMELILANPESPGSVTFLPRGFAMRRELVTLKREALVEFGFQEVLTPTIWTHELWKASGHWDNYRTNMFLLADDKDKSGEFRSGLKPMNCPGHCKIFASKPRSYRDLPIRIAEFGVVHRNEPSGALTGMLRVSTFTQDDAHLFVAPDQLEQELLRLIEMYGKLYTPFGFGRIEIVVSTRPENRLGSDERWDLAEGALFNALDKASIEYEVKPGEGAFYGPKIDYLVHDAIGRAWQTGTIQVDFNLPERFGLSYMGRTGAPERPVMIHPATFGSLERFMAILIESFEGKFPTWLAPVQVAVLPISEKSFSYADRVECTLRAHGCRVETDRESDRIGRKIVRAHTTHPPYMAIVGPREERTETVSVRDRNDVEQPGVTLDRFVDQLLQDIKARRQSPFEAEQFHESNAPSVETAT